jgi:L-ascorbate oxidase
MILPGNTYDANHPFHLHGHAFHVMAVERLGNATSREEVQNHVEKGKVKRHNLYAPLKDTVTVPDGGFSLLRVKASNPGKSLQHSKLRR